MPTIEPVSRSAMETNTTTFSPFSSWNVFNYASSLYSMGKNFSFLTFLQNGFVRIKDWIKSFYLQRTCLRDLEACKQAFNKSPFLCISAFLDAVLNDPETARGILVSLFHENREKSRSAKKDHEYLGQLVIIDAFLKDLLLSPDLMQIKKILECEIESEGIQEEILRKKGNKISSSHKKYEEWEINILESILNSLKNATEFYQHEVKDTKLNRAFNQLVINSHEQKIVKLCEFFSLIVKTISKIIDERRGNIFCDCKMASFTVFANILEKILKELFKQKLLSNYEVIFRKLHTILSNPQSIENLFYIIRQLSWEYNIHHGGAIYKTFKESKNTSVIQMV